MVLTAALLAATTALVDDIHNGVAARGYTDIRPTHGFVFVRLSPDGATVATALRTRRIASLCPTISEMPTPP